MIVSSLLVISRVKGAHRLVKLFLLLLFAYGYILYREGFFMTPVNFALLLPNLLLQ